MTSISRSFLLDSHGNKNQTHNNNNNNNKTRAN